MDDGRGKVAEGGTSESREVEKEAGRIDEGGFSETANIGWDIAIEFRLRGITALDDALCCISAPRRNCLKF